MATWKEDTIQALKNLGGVAHLSKIHKEVEKLRKGNLNPTWTQTIQRELETYSSDSDVWNSKSRNLRLQFLVWQRSDFFAE